MINFISLTMRNFMSYGNNNTTINFDKKGSILIDGENGAGKSTIINALSFCLYGKPLSDISLDNLVNNINKKDLFVAVDFEIDGIYYRVERARKSKRGNWCKFYSNSKEYSFKDETCNKTLDSTGGTNELIEKKLGMIHDLFTRIIVFSANHVPFLDLPVRHPNAPNQTKIIEELFSITRLSEKARILKQELMKENELMLKSKKMLLTQLEKEHERHEEQIKTAKTRVVQWEKKRKIQINSLEVEIKNQEKIDIGEQKTLHKKLKDISLNVNNISSEITKSESLIKKLKAEIVKKEKELKILLTSKCPRCKQSYAGAEEEAVEVEKFITGALPEFEKKEKELVKLKTDVEKIHSEQDQIEAKIIVDDLETLLEMKSTVNNNKTRLKEMIEEINPFFDALDELEEIKIEEINYSEINELDSIIEHQKFLYKLLTNKDSFVRKALLDKNIPFLNMKLQEYLSELGLPHIVQFNHNLTATIMQFGHNLDFGNLSNGQRSRVNLALSLSFRDVLQSLHHKINICLFDEVLDQGLNAEGVQSAARLLKRKARDENVIFFIISHRDGLDSTFDDKMTIELKSGFSYIS